MAPADEDRAASDEDADAFVLDEEGEELLAHSPRRPRSAARLRPASSTNPRVRRPGSAMSTCTDDFIKEDGSDAEEDTIESQHQHIFPVPGSGGILSRNACRPSTAPSRQLSTMVRRPASALGGRGPKERPTSAASIAKSEASAASAASTHIAAFRPNSAHSFLSSRPASALSSRPHSAMSQQQWASSTSVEGADIHGML